MSAKGAMTVGSASRRVLQSITAAPRRPLQFRALDGSAPLIVVLPSDYLSVTLDRVRNAGGAANVAVADMKGYQIVVLETDQDGEDEDANEYPNDMSMGMFLIRTKSRRGSWQFRLSGVRAGLSSTSGVLAYA